MNEGGKRKVVRLVAMKRQRQMQLQTKISVLQVLIHVYLPFLVVRHLIPGECVRFMLKIR